jgi:hypothetical protein
MNPQAPSLISLGQWVHVLHRWLGLRHALVVGYSQQAHSLLSGDTQAVTLFKAGSPVAKPAASPAAHAQASYAVAHTLPWLIAEHTGPVTFHLANLSSESGLLPAASLTACWPGIKPLGQHQASALSLDDACAQASAEFAWSSPPQWLWIGCLPATALLRGATRLLQQTDVVALRVQLHPEALPDASLHGAQSLLQTHGFALCGVEPERNPHLGTALFVRDYPAAHSDTRQQRDQLSQFHGEMQARLSAETQAKESEANAKAEAQRQRGELAQAQAELQVRLSVEIKAKETEAAAKAEAQRQRDELAQAHAELQARLSAETLAKEAEAADKAEAQRQRDELAQAQAELQARLSAETQAKESETNAKSEALRQHVELTRAHAELQARLSAETQAKESETNAKREALRQHEELTRAHVELQARLSAETQAKESETNAKSEALRQHEELTRAHAELQARLRAETQAKQTEADGRVAAQQQVQSLAQAKEQANAIAQALLQEKTSLETAQAQLAAQLQTLEQANKTLLNQQTRMHDRFIAAEAQIDLIKQLILSDRMESESSLTEEDLGLELDPNAPSNSDPKLLQRVITQWQFGDWQSLAQLDLSTLQHHPDRAALALYAAAGQQQIGDMNLTRRFMRMAQVWGCEPIHIKQVLISGLNNSLGRVAAELGQNQRSRQHFETAIDIGSPDADRLVKQARVTYQLQQLTDKKQVLS